MSYQGQTEFLNIGSNDREDHLTSSSSCCLCSNSMCLYSSEGEQCYFPCLCDGSPTGSHGKSMKRKKYLARAEFYDFFPLATSCEQYICDCGGHQAAHERSYFYVFHDRIELNTPIMPFWCLTTESCVLDDVQVHYHDKSFSVRKFFCCFPIPSALCGNPIIRAKQHYAWECCCCRCGGLSRMRGESIVVAKASLWLLHPPCCVDRCYMHISTLFRVLCCPLAFCTCAASCVLPCAKALFYGLYYKIINLFNFSEVLISGISNSNAVVVQWAQAVHDYHELKGIAPDGTSVFETQRMGDVRTCQSATRSLIEIPVGALEMDRSMV
jgi:hypothetical protein